MTERGNTALVMVVLLGGFGRGGGFVWGCTYGAIGEFTKGSTLREGSGAGERGGQEGESRDGVLHFVMYIDAFFLASFRSGLEVL